MYAGYLFDLDGTLWRGNTPIPGAVETVRRLQAAGARIGYVTNNSTQSTEQFVAKLNGMGFPTEGCAIKSTASGAAAYVAAEGIGSAYVVGESGLHASMAAVAEVTDGSPEAVVVGLCFSFDYEKLKTAMRAIRGGARFIATNRDVTYPMEGGNLIPGAGSVVAAVAAAAEREPIVIGKPEPTMILQCLAELGLRAEETLVVGDRLDTDIESGQRAGCPVHLVLSGVETVAPLGMAHSLDVNGLG